VSVSTGIGRSSIDKELPFLIKRDIFIKIPLLGCVLTIYIAEKLLLNSGSHAINKIKLAI
jgi:hypothetical protein